MTSGRDVEALVTRIAAQRAQLAQSRSFTAIREVARDLGLHRVAEKQVVVGGTNGKGSTVGYLQQILSQRGVRVGTTTSPHLHSYLERIALNGGQVDAHQCTEAIHSVAEATVNTPLTYFDLTTLAALDLFRLWEVDVAIVEVGLGGRLDCANVVESDIAVITNVDIDHTAELGNTIEEITQEKVGIARPDKPFVFADYRENRVVNAYVEKHASPFFRIGREFGSRNTDFLFVTNGNVNLSFPLPTAMNHAETSFSTALQVATLLDLAPSADALRTMCFSTPLGRLEQGYARDRHWILDVAHNPAAIRYLRQALACHDITECVVVFACFSDKDVRGMLDSLLNPLDNEAAHVVEVVITDSHGARAMTATTASENCDYHNRGIEIKSQLDDALSRAVRVSAPNVPIVVLGSFDIVSRARRTLNMCETDILAV